MQDFKLSYLQGVFSSRGKYILMADADGATKFEDIEKVEKALRNLQPWPVSLHLVTCFRNVDEIFSSCTPKSPPLYVCTAVSRGTFL